MKRLMAESTAQKEYSGRRSRFLLVRWRGGRSNERAWSGFDTVISPPDETVENVDDSRVRISVVGDVLLASFQGSFKARTHRNSKTSWWRPPAPRQEAFCWSSVTFPRSTEP